MTKKLFSTFGMALLAIALMVSLAEASVIVQGTVRDAVTFVGIGNVKVEFKENGVAGSRTRIWTISDGSFSITSLKHDTLYDFIFRARGYAARAMSAFTPSFDPLNDPLTYTVPDTDLYLRKQ